MKKYYINGKEVDQKSFVERYINFKTITTEDSLLLSYLHHILVNGNESKDLNRILEAIYVDVLDLDFKILTQMEILGTVFEAIPMPEPQPVQPSIIKPQE